MVFPLSFFLLQSSTDVVQAGESAPKQLLLIGQQLAQEVHIGCRARSSLLQPAQGVQQCPPSMLHEEGQRYGGAAAPAQTAVDQDASCRLGLQRCVDEPGRQRQRLHQVLLCVVAQMQPQVAQRVGESVGTVGSGVDHVCDVQVLDDAVVRRLRHGALVEGSLQDLRGVDGEGEPLRLQQDHTMRAEERIKGSEGGESPQQDDRVHSQGTELKETALEARRVFPGLHTAH